MISTEHITGLILAGGRGMRMGQVNKGLQLLQRKPMVEHVIERLRPQVSTIIINANQDLDTYKQYTDSVYPDEFAGYAGPLAGIHCGLRHCQTPYLISVPCDSPFIPADLVKNLAVALRQTNAQLAVVTCMDHEETPAKMRAQPVFSMMDKSLSEHLSNFLESGGRKVSDWYKTISVVEVAFDDHQAFRNINTIDQLQQYTHQ
jgi:molybdenum cofactor guanylyltransferase